MLKAQETNELSPVAFKKLDALLGKSPSWWEAVGARHSSGALPWRSLPSDLFPL